MSDIDEYNEKQTGETQKIVTFLRGEILRALPESQGKVYHAHPAWFMNENPIVGYDVSDHGVNILFWSGQSFQTPGLTAKGKFKAAGTTYTAVADIDGAQLQAWLEESKTVQWDYKNLRANNGVLTKLS